MATSSVDVDVTTERLNKAWAGFRVVLPDVFTFGDIKEIVALGGIDVTRLSHLVQRAGGGASRGQLMTALDGQIGALGEKEKKRVLVAIADEMVRREPAVLDQVNQHLKRLGWSYTGGALVPVEIFDPGELDEVPDVARTDLVKAAARFRDGDLSGALHAACAAVDSATNAIYERDDLGDPEDSFQKKCSRALASAKTVEALVDDLVELGWAESDARILGKNVTGSLNQGALVMQRLRSRMGDAHGTKKALRTVVFDSLKWASLIVSALK